MEILADAGRSRPLRHASSPPSSIGRRSWWCPTDRPLLIDRYLSDAIEVDVDCLSDGKDTFIAGIMEHIEEAGIHSGDSACSLPAHSLAVLDPRADREARPATSRWRSTSSG